MFDRIGVYIIIIIRRYNFSSSSNIVSFIKAVLLMPISLISSLYKHFIYSKSIFASFFFSTLTWSLRLNGYFLSGQSFSRYDNYKSITSSLWMHIKIVTIHLFPRLSLRLISLLLMTTQIVCCRLTFCGVIISIHVERLSDYFQVCVTFGYQESFNFHLRTQTRKIHQPVWNETNDKVEVKGCLPDAIQTPGSWWVYR